MQITNLEIKHSDIDKANYESLFNTIKFLSTYEVTEILSWDFCFTTMNGRLYVYKSMYKVGDGQGGLACCDSWGRKESDTTERLNWTATEQLANCGSWNSSASVMVGPMPYNKLLSLSVCLYIYIYCVCVRAHHTPLIHNTNTFTYSHIPPLQVLCLWRTLTNTLNLYCFQHFYF
jgi:hypothetical protein